MTMHAGLMQFGWMHLGLVVATLMVSIILRLSWRVADSYQQRWQQALIRFLVPACLPVMTAIAIILMGPSGHMVTYWEGWSIYSLAWGFVGLAISLGLVSGVSGWQSVQSAKAQPCQELYGYQCRVLATHLPYSAQVGFWEPELMVSRGLMESLTDAQLQAVLVHEMGHYAYRDTFWFFWLGWLRRLTAWLPNTQALWEELLLLREIRADQWATQQVDQLVLAESLVQVAKAPLMQTCSLSAAFSCQAVGNRMQERINALLSDSSEFDWQRPLNGWTWCWLAWIILPLLTVPFHH
ncbi:MAG: M56 family metallopeptidase [Thainema sp.]